MQTTVRPSTRRELAATLVLRLTLDQASIKVRASGATTAPDDGEPRQVWAGVVPLTIQAGTPQPSEDTPRQVPAPASVLRTMRRCPNTLDLT